MWPFKRRKTLSEKVEKLIADQAAIMKFLTKGSSDISEAAISMTNLIENIHRRLDEAEIRLKRLEAKIK